MTLVWISKPVVEAISLSAIYYCICPFLCSCRSFNPSLCRLWPFLLSYVTREFTRRRRRRQRERQNINGFRLAKQQLCTCITLFCTFLCRRYTTTTFTFCRGREHKKAIFFFFSWTLMQFFGIHLQKHFSSIQWRIKGDGISVIKFEAAQIHYLSDFFVPIAVVLA